MRTPAPPRYETPGTAPIPFDAQQATPPWEQLVSSGTALPPQLQPRPATRKSNLGPVLLITLGLIVSVLHAGRFSWQALLLWTGRWWPVLLVASGLFLFAEWALDQYVSNLPQARRKLGGLALLGLLGVAFTGITVTTATHLSRQFLPYVTGSDADEWTWLRPFGSNASDTDTLSAPLQPSQTLEIHNPHGSITIAGVSSDQQIHIQTSRHSWAWDSSEALKLLKAHPSTLTAIPRGMLFSGSAEDVTTDLQIQLPPQTNLQIDRNSGNLSISGLHGSLAVQDHQGDLTLDEITGAVDLHLQDESAHVTGHRITGDVALHGQVGDVDLADVKGQLELIGDLFGTTRLERIAGPVHFASSYTDVRCGHLPGTLEVEGRSELHLDQAVGPVVISTTNRELTLDHISGPSDVRTTNGSVTFSAQDLEQLHIATTNASIQLNVPHASNFRLNAETTHGAVHTFFDSSADDQTAVHAQHGTGGPSLNLTTTNDDITVDQDPH